MSDHAIGLIGLALAVVSIVAPFRWREMPRWATDIGILVGAILAGTKEWKNWYTNGQIKFDGYYKEDSLDGEFKKWHEMEKLKHSENSILEN